MTTFIAVGPDGYEFEFPEGTPPHVVSATIARHYGNQPEAQRDRLNATTAVTAPNKRSAGERWRDVLSNTMNTAWIAEGWRAGNLEGSRLQRMAADPNVTDADVAAENERINNIAGSPARDFGRFWGIATERLTGRGVEMTERAIAEERARKAEFSQESSADPFWEAEGGFLGKTWHGAAALTGTLTGAATDPTSYITGGTTIWGKMLVQAAVAGGTDVIAQTDALGLTQDEYRIEQTAMSAGAGAAFTGAFEGVARLIRKPGANPPTNDAIAQAMREDLDASDAVNRPLLTMDDVTTRPLPEGMPLKDVTPPKDASVPALANPDPRMDGPEVKSAEDVRAEAGAKTEEPKSDDPWNGVDWGTVGSTQRGKAVMAHLDRLKTFIRPEQIDTFVRWLGKEQMDIADDASHWNRDFFDFDTLNNDPDKFEELTNVMADIFRPLYDGAGQAKQTWDSTIQRQTLFGITISDAIKAHADLTGDGGAAAKIHAIETIAIQQTDELLGAIGKLETEIGQGVKNNATIEAVAAQLQAASLLDAMAGGAKSEIGRALNIMKMAKKRTTMVNDIQASWTAMQDALGTNDLSDDALAAALKRMREAYGEGGAVKARDELRKMKKLGLSDYLSTYIVTGYLSNPATAFRNLIGSVLHATMTVAERYVAAGVTGPIRRTVMGKRTSAETVTFREANAYVHGIHQNFVDAARMSKRAFLDAKPITDAATSIGDTARTMPFELNAARRAKWNKNRLLAVPDMAATALFVSLRTLGVRPSLAMDEFTKVMGRGMQLNALAVREAAYRSARVPQKDKAKVFARTLDSVTNRPTAEALARAKQSFDEIGQEFDASKIYNGDTRLEEAADILQAVNLQDMANDYARLLAFQKTGPTVEAFERALNRMRFIKALYVPFFRTPINLVRAGMVDRNPALAWITKENRVAFKDYFRVMSEQEAALTKGGAEADIVMARMVTGIGFMSMASMLFCNGDLVGKRSKAEEQDGVKSYSIRIGGRWYGYNQLSPLAEMLGMVSDMHQAWRDKDASDDALTAMAGGVLSAITNNIVNKAALQGVGDFFDMMDPAFAKSDETRGTIAAKAAFKKVGDSLVPAIVRNIAWEQDPVMRQANGFIESFMVNLPGLSESVAERRDWLGQPIVRPDNPLGLLQPMRVTDVTDDIVRREVSVLAQNDPDLLLAANPPQRFNGQKITPREFARLLEVQSQEYRSPVDGTNMHEALTTLVNSPEFADMADPQRAFEIKRVVASYRRQATAAIKRGDYPELTEMVNRTGARQAIEYGEERGLDMFQVESRARSYGVDPTVGQDLLNFNGGD